MPRDNVDNKPVRFYPGMKKLPSRQLNALVDGLNRRLVGVSAPTQPKPNGKSGGSPVLILTLVAHGDDYLTCEDADANPVYVAKQYELQRTPFDGVTVAGVTFTYTSESEREATNGVDDPETQFITPAYVVGAEIYAIKVQGDTGINDPTPEPIVYVEINQARAWAFEPPP